MMDREERQREYGLKVPEKEISNRNYASSCRYRSLSYLRLSALMLVIAEILNINSDPTSAANYVSERIANDQVYGLTQRLLQAAQRPNRFPMA